MDHEREMELFNAVTSALITQGIEPLCALHAAEAAVKQIIKEETNVS